MSTAKTLPDFVFEVTMSLLSLYRKHSSFSSPIFLYRAILQPSVKNSSMHHATHLTFQFSGRALITFLATITASSATAMPLKMATLHLCTVTVALGSVKKS